MRRLVVAMTVALVLGGLAGCGPGEGKGARLAESGSPTPSAHSSASPSAGTPSPDESGKTGKEGTVELRGTVESGVEAGCLILRTGGKTYSLIGGDRDVVKAGASVVVRGTEEPGMMTICQQGTPFKVAEAYAR